MPRTPSPLSLLLLFLLFCLGQTAALGQLVRPVVGENALYVSRLGDSLLNIAEAHGLAIEHLAFANGFPVSSSGIVAGTLITIPGQRILPANPPKNGLVLNIPERGMYLFRNDKFEDFIPVSVGLPPDSKTPLGSFTVIEKVINPTWYPTAKANVHKPVPPGPDNPLGDRWIGLSAPRVGIHGTNNPLNVGAPVTLGCIRCYPSEIRKLFPKAYVGMPVRIEYETAKIGINVERELQIVTFPDIYRKSDPYQRSTSLLAKVGRSDALKSKNFCAQLKLNLGRPLNLGAARPSRLGNMGAFGHISLAHPLKVGVRVTLDCIRCYPNEVRALFEEAYIGMSVRIEYETAKLGIDEQRNIYIVTFPDVYDRADPCEKGRSILLKAAGSEFLSDDNSLANLRLNLGKALTVGRVGSDRLGRI